MNFFFFEDKYDTSYYLMRDVEKHPNVKIIYKDRLHNSKILNFLLKLGISKKLQRYISLPGKSFLYKYILKKKCNIGTNETICITMISAWYDDLFLRTLKNSFENSFFVLILRDTVKSNSQRDKFFSINKAKKDFNLILSYDDEYDVKKYDLVYAPVYMSKIDELTQLKTRQDISLVVAAKDRIHTIHKFANLFDNKGISYRFHVIGASQKSKENTKIAYGKKPLNRHDCLECELSSNCILEILKGDAHSNTLRFLEAVIYNKKILTNWKGAIHSKYYDPRFVKVYDDIDKIDLEFIRKREDVNYSYFDDLSPIHLLELIEDYYNRYKLGK